MSGGKDNLGRTARGAVAIPVPRSGAKGSAASNGSAAAAGSMDAGGNKDSKSYNSKPDAKKPTISGIKKELEPGLSIPVPRSQVDLPRSMGAREGGARAHGNGGATQKVTSGEFSKDDGNFKSAKGFEDVFKVNTSWLRFDVSVGSATELRGVAKDLGVESQTFIQSAVDKGIRDRLNMLWRSEESQSARAFTYLFPIMGHCIHWLEDGVRSESPTRVSGGSSGGQKMAPIFAVILTDGAEASEMVEECCGWILEGVKSHTHKPTVVHALSGRKLSKDGLDQEVHVLISTPRRVLEHLHNSTAFAQRLEYVRYLVFDGLDAILDAQMRGETLKMLESFSPEAQCIAVVNDVSDDVVKFVGRVLGDDFTLFDPPRTITRTTVNPERASRATPELSQLVSVGGPVVSPPKSSSASGPSSICVPLSDLLTCLVALVVAEIRREPHGYKIVVSCSTSAITKLVASLIEEAVEVPCQTVVASQRPFLTRNIVTKFCEDSRGILCTSAVDIPGAVYDRVTLAVQLGCGFFDRERSIVSPNVTSVFETVNARRNIVLISDVERHVLRAHNGSLSDGTVPAMERVRVEQAMSRVRQALRHAAYSSMISHFQDFVKVSPTVLKSEVQGDVALHLLGLDFVPRPGVNRESGIDSDAEADDIEPQPVATFRIELPSGSTRGDGDVIGRKEHHKDGSAITAVSSTSGLLSMLSAHMASKEKDDAAARRLGPGSIESDIERSTSGGLSGEFTSANASSQGTFTVQAVSSQQILSNATSMASGHFLQQPSVQLSPSTTGVFVPSPMAGGHPMMMMQSQQFAPQMYPMMQSQSGVQGYPQQSVMMAPAQGQPMMGQLQPQQQQTQFGGHQQPASAVLPAPTTSNAVPATTTTTTSAPVSIALNSDPTWAAPSDLLSKITAVDADIQPVATAVGGSADAPGSKLPVASTEERIHRTISDLLDDDQVIQPRVSSGSARSGEVASMPAAPSGESAGVANQGVWMASGHAVGGGAGEGQMMYQQQQPMMMMQVPATNAQAMPQQQQPQQQQQQQPQMMMYQPPHQSFGAAQGLPPSHVNQQQQQQAMYAQGYSQAPQQAMGWAPGYGATPAAVYPQMAQGYPQQSYAAPAGYTYGDASMAQGYVYQPHQQGYSAPQQQQQQPGYIAPQQPQQYNNPQQQQQQQQGYIPQQQAGYGAPQQYQYSTVAPAQYGGQGYGTAPANNYAGAPVYQPTPPQYQQYAQAK